MAVDHDPSLFSRSVAPQTQALLIKPLNQTTVRYGNQGSSNVRPRLIIVDGLDECNDASSQSEILAALSAAVRQLTFPLLFLSRLVQNTIFDKRSIACRWLFNDRNSVGLFLRARC
ncbi:hypothetical protein BDZ97DRAFT_1821109 [Flammula alnicola]|nr:hypothetical protein BDZ97DRAFT_1821109 [Flammula alnicola]